MKTITIPPQTETEIVQNSVKGKFYKTINEAYEFINNKEVNLWTEIDNSGKYYKYQKATFLINSQKQYIDIKTETGNIRLYYEIVGNTITIYTDSNKKNNLNESTKTDDFINESKLPNIEDGTIVLSPKTHYTYFTNRQPNPMNGIRQMYVMDKKTDEIILTFEWHSYERMSEMRNIDPMENKSLFRTDMAVWLKKITDANYNVYAYNTTTNNEVKVKDTNQIISTGMYITTLSIHLEDEPNHTKYTGTLEFEYTQYV